MNIEELRMEWNSVQERTQFPDAVLLASVKARAVALEQTIRRRDRREAIAAGVVFVLFLLPLITGPWLSRIGAMIVMAACIIVVRQMRRARLAHPPLPADRPLAETLDAERSRIETQIRLLQTVPWWYAAPLSTGVVLVYAGIAGATWSTLLYAAVVAAMAAAIVALNRQAIRRQLLPALEDLDRLREQLHD